MIAELEKTIASEEATVKDSDKLIKLLEKNLADAKEELKALKKQKIKDIARTPEDEDVIIETYAELEEEAKKMNAGLYFEASCVGGVPIIRTLIDGMQGNKLLLL